MSKKNEKLYLIDASAVIYRAFYAFIRNPLINSKGKHTSALFGFVSHVLRLIQEEGPSYLAIVQDLPGPTFRHKMYKEYKANRKPMPDELREQLPIIDEFIGLTGLPCVSKEGFEADDVMGTLTALARKNNLDVYLITRDKDMMQIVDDHVCLYEPAAGSQLAEVRGPEAVMKKFGVGPEKIVDLLALMGDSADNVPGVAKVGPKTAADLLNEYGNLDGIYDHLDEITRKALKKNLENDKDNAYLSRELVELDCKVPLDIDLADLKVSGINREKVAPFLEEWELKSMAAYLSRMSGDTPGVTNVSSGVPEAPQKQKPTVPKNYTLVDTQEKLKQVVSELEKAKVIAVDTETTGLNNVTASLVGLCLSSKKDEGWYIPVGHQEGPNLDPDDVAAQISPLIDTSRRFVFHHAKYDLPILERSGFDFSPLYGTDSLVDTLIAAYLCNPGARHLSLDDLSREILGHEMISIEQLIGKKGKNQKSFEEVSIEDAFQYGAEDADITLSLWEHFEKELEVHGQTRLFYDVEMALMPVLLKMEQEGITLDVTGMNGISDSIAADITSHEKEIYRIAGHEFNIGSTRQLGEVLFDELGLKAGKKTKTGYSTDHSVLMGLQGSHEIIDHLLEFRELTKLKNTYTDVLPGLVVFSTGRIHTSYSQTIAATGRLSSINPNLQNIPIRTDQGKKIRSCFIPGKGEYLLLSADYSQIELRVLAHISQDPGLMRAYNEGVDIHTQTAAALYEVDEAEVSDDMRRSAKAVNFGVIYGMGPQRLSRELGIDRKEASRFIDQYFARYSEVRTYIDGTIKTARDQGYVETISGHRRYFPDIASGNRMVKDNAERMAVNTPIQGSAADLIKLAMIDIHGKLQSSGLDCRMLLQVHDELVFEVHEKDLKKAQDLIIESMEGAMDLSVPLVVEAGSGKSWLEAH